MTGTGYAENTAEMKRRFDNMSDFNIREAGEGDNTTCFLYISNFSSKKLINRFVIEPVLRAFEDGTDAKLSDIITNASVKELADADEAEAEILAGSVVVISRREESFGIAAATKNEDGRGTDEPETENVIRGPHEGFTESGENNAVLIRRRLKSASLKKESLTVGSVTGTSVSLMYLSDRVNEKALTILRERLRSIKTDGVTDSGHIEIFIQDGRLPLYPTVGNSERPDKIVAKLLEGRIAVITDGSPVVLTVPYLFCEGFQVAEDYSKSVWYGTFIRLLRMTAFVISLTLPAIFCALFIHHQSLVPGKLLELVSEARSDISYPILWELIGVLVIFEAVREVGLRMPKAVGAAVGIVGSLVLGDSAVEAGLISSPVLITAAMAAVCNFIVPPYMNPSVLLRFILIISAGAGGLAGFFAAVFVFVVLAVGKTSFSVPYFAPAAPAELSGLGDFIVMLPVRAMKKLPPQVSGRRAMRNGEKGGKS